MEASLFGIRVQIYAFWFFPLWAKLDAPVLFKIVTTIIF